MDFEQDLLTKLNGFLRTIKPRMKLRYGSYPNLFHVLVEVFCFLVERKPVYNKTQANAIIDLVHNDPNLQRISRKFQYAPPPRSLGGDVVVPTNQATLGGRVTFDEICQKKSITNVGDLFRFLEIHKPMISMDFDDNVGFDRSLKSPLLAPILKERVTRATIKEFRSLVFPAEYNTSKHHDEPRSFCASILKFFDTNHKLAAVAPKKFIDELERVICTAQWNDKFQSLPAALAAFLNVFFGHHRFSLNAGGLNEWDPNGMLRLSYFVNSDNQALELPLPILDEVFGTDRDAVYKTYKATCDWDLLVNASKGYDVVARKLRMALYKYFENGAVNRLGKALNSITLVNILTKFTSIDKDFSYIVFGVEDDFKGQRLWANARKNHFVLMLLDSEEWFHWYALGRYVLKNGSAVFYIYCSFGINETDYHSAYQHLLNQASVFKGSYTVRAPIIQNQDGGVWCGYWTMLLAYSMCKKNDTEFIDLFTKHRSVNNLSSSFTEILLL